jgi:enoyl-CoA hydratase/carnithine racemase
LAAEVRSTVDAGVAIISLNRPRVHNAINSALRGQLWGALEGAVADPGVRCIVLRGEGKSFCSGIDVGELGHDHAVEGDLDFVRAVQRRTKLILDAPKPVIAALKGAVLGGGLELALAADIRLAARDTRLALPEVRFGLVTEASSQILTALIGPSRAKYLVMSGEAIDAEQAEHWGLVDLLCEPGEVDDAAAALAARLAEAPALTLALAKQLIDQAWAERVRAGMAQELLAQSLLFNSEGFRLRSRPAVSGL